MQIRENSIVTLIGSRKAPYNILTLATLIGRKLASLNCVCRSGAAEGMDTAFEAGFPNELKEIYQPWKNFMVKTNNISHIVVTDKRTLANARLIASKIHPFWKSLNKEHANLHTRNVFQVLGQNLNLKSDFLVCWAPPENNSVKGGTKTAYNLAKRLGIPCYNLYDSETRLMFTNWLNS